MTTYDLYLESGPKRRRTMVHVPALLGCIAIGETTDAALAATPDAIRSYLRFLASHGETVDPDAPFETVVAAHVTEGQWLGNGSPSVTFAPDFEPVDEAGIEQYLRWFHWLTEALATWAERQDAAALAASPAERGRQNGAVLLHVLGPVGGYLSAALGGAKGFSAAAGAAERGGLALPDALRRVELLAAEAVRATTPEQRAAVRQRPNDLRTLRKALRRMLEHHWEHLLELSRRPGGPSL